MGSSDAALRRRVPPGAGRCKLLWAKLKFWRVRIVQDVFILSGVRTPIGKFGGKLAHLTSPDLGVVAAKAALDRAGVSPEQVEETIFGSARQAGNGPNPARQISIRSGVPKEASAYTVNKACASGMQAIALGYQEIAIGNLDCVLTGGTESMSRVPYYLDKGRWGYRLGNQELVDGMYRDGFACPLCDLVMGEIQDWPRGAGRVCSAIATAGGKGDQGGQVQG
jgi:acetyl-CoA C-acetyltransferase